MHIDGYMIYGTGGWTSLLTQEETFQCSSFCINHHRWLSVAHFSTSQSSSATASAKQNASPEHLHHMGHVNAQTLNHPSDSSMRQWVTFLPWLRPLFPNKKGQWKTLSLWVLCLPRHCCAAFPDAIHARSCGLSWVNSGMRPLESAPQAWLIDDNQSFRTHFSTAPKTMVRSARVSSALVDRCAKVPQLYNSALS